MTKNGKRPTIGLLIESIGGLGGYQSPLWAGVNNAAVNHDVNLLCFTWEMVKTKNNDQYNRIYGSITERTIDGIIITTAIIDKMDRKVRDDFYRKIQNIPIVSISNRLDRLNRARCVSFENSDSMTELMRHLIEDHHRKRIAFIKGPKKAKDANERYKIFKRIAKKYGLFNDRLITKGDFTPDSGRNAVKELIDKGARFDTIVAANDNMAIAAIEELRKNNKKCPEKVLVVGFDDIEGAAENHPSLTTISQPRYEQGKKALEMVLDLINGKEVADIPLLTSLKLRESCGCSPLKEVSANIDMLYKIDHTPFFLKLKDTFLDNVKSSNLEINLFIKELLQSLDNDKNPDILFYQHKLTELYHEIIHNLDYEKQKKALRLFEAANIILINKVKKEQIIIKIDVQKQLALSREISDELYKVVDLNNLLSILEKKIPQLGIKTFYIVRNKKSYTTQYADTTQTTILQNELFPAELSEILLEVQDGRKVTTNKTYESALILPKNKLQSLEPYSIVVEPLHFGSNQFGFALLKLEPSKEGDISEEGDIFEFLRGQISSALKAINTWDIWSLIASETIHLIGNKISPIRRRIDEIFELIEHLYKKKKIKKEIYNQMIGNIKIIQEGAEQVQSIKSDLIERIVHKQTIYPTVLLNEIIVSNRSEYPKIKFNFHDNKKRYSILADPQIIKRIFEYIIKNAVQAIEDKYLFHKKSYIGFIDIKIANEINYFVIDFKDNGCGINKDDLDRIFQPFFTTKGADRGSGVGLYFCKRIIEDLGGEIKLKETKIGKGTTISIRLPIASS